LLRQLFEIAAMAYKMLVMAGVEYELECDGGNVLIK